MSFRIAAPVGGFGPSKQPHQYSQSSSHQRLRGEDDNHDAMSDLGTGVSLGEREPWDAQMVKVMPCMRSWEKLKEDTVREVLSGQLNE